MIENLNDRRLPFILYFLSLAFLLSIPYLIEYPVGDEFAYVKQTRLLLEGKTQPNWLLSTSYITMLLGMPIIKYAFSFFNLRLLMMVIAATVMPLMYLILREIGAKKDIAVLGAFILLASPFVTLYLRQFITEPISVPLYLLTILFSIKGIKNSDQKFFIIGSIFAILGFLNKQIDLIAAIAVFVFVLLNKWVKNYENKILITSIPIAFALAFFAYNFVTAGSIVNPTTIPSTVSPDAPYAPQIGFNLRHSSFRLIQDIIYLGFFFFPFTIYLRRHLKPITKLLNFSFPTSQKIILLASALVATLAVISGKGFIFHSNEMLVFVSALAFSYSGLNLGLFIFQNRDSSQVAKYSFIALIGCVLFTIFKINIFLIKYYVVFLPFLLMFISMKIKERLPYILTILVLGGFGITMSINDIQHHEKVWNEVTILLNYGVEPSDLQGHPTVIGWVNDLVDNIYGNYNIIIKKHSILNDFVDIATIRIEKLEI